MQKFKVGLILNYKLNYIVLLSDIMWFFNKHIHRFLESNACAQFSRDLCWYCIGFL